MKISNKVKDIAVIAAIALASIAFMPSCSKEQKVNDAKHSEVKGISNTGSAGSEKSNRKGAKKEGKETVASMKSKTDAASKANTVFLGEGVSLKAIRDGQYVNLSWQIDASADKFEQINITRSSTGITKKKRVAELSPGTTSFRDCLPNDTAHWYWLVLATENNKGPEFGPVKVDIDKTGPANYIKQEDIYKASVNRTDALATIVWDFPNVEYKSIRIVRNAKPVEEPFKGNSTPILKTLASKSQSTDALPDINSEYWYWFQITLKSGAVIYIGPIKAEYAKAKR